MTITNSDILEVLNHHRVRGMGSTYQRIDKIYNLLDHDRIDSESQIGDAAAQLIAAHTELARQLRSMQIID